MRTSVRGHPLRSARRKWRRMLGYLVFENVMLCTPEGVVQVVGSALVSIVAVAPDGVSWVCVMGCTGG